MPPKGLAGLRPIRYFHAHVNSGIAQLVERLAVNEDVGGSNPSPGAIQLVAL